MTTFEVYEPAPEKPIIHLEQQPVEGVVLHNGDVVLSPFLAKDGLVRAWLKRSVEIKEMSHQEAEQLYRRWNPDPEFHATDLFI